MTTTTTPAGTKVAPCRQLPRLFDSTDLLEHMTARALCGSCSAETNQACRRVALDTNGTGTYGAALFVNGWLSKEAAETC